MYFPSKRQSLVRNGSIVLGRLSLSRLQRNFGTVKYAKQSTNYLWTHFLDQHSAFCIGGVFMERFMFLEWCGVVNFGLNTLFQFPKKCPKTIVFFTHTVLPLKKWSKIRSIFVVKYLDHNGGKREANSIRMMIPNDFLG